MTCFFSHRGGKHPRWVLHKLLAVMVIAAMAWLSACASNERSCSDHSGCAADEVCSSEGMCENIALREKKHADIIQSLDDNTAALALWSMYGTAGALANATVMEDINQSSIEKSADGNAEVLCSMWDVRTDDLSFTITRNYPNGYWGSLPIADSSNARCGDDLETLAWRLLNCERISRDLPPVDCDLRLVWIGRQHGDDMVHRGFFGHINPDGQNTFARFSGRGILYQSAGENLARQYTIFDAHKAWMASPLHRRNMLEVQYDYAGIGVVASGHQLLLAETFLRNRDDPKPEEDASETQEEP